MNRILDSISVAAFQRQNFLVSFYPFWGAHIQDKEPTPQPRRGRLRSDYLEAWKWKTGFLFFQPVFSVN